MSESLTRTCKRPCAYLDGHGICNYYLDTGIRRPNPAGAGCTVRKAGMRRDEHRAPEETWVGRWHASQQKATPPVRKSSEQKPKAAKWDADLALRLKQEGKTWVEVAEAVGSTTNAVMRHFKRIGVNIKSEPKKVKVTWDVEKGHEMFLAGKSLHEIGEALGASYGSVRGFAYRNWEKRPKR